MILFFDTETTGLPKNWKAPVTDIDNWPRLVQLAYLIYDYEGNLIHSCNEIIKPDGFIIPTDSSNVHGITTEIAIQRGSNLTDVLELFQHHLKRINLLVAHNMAFDEKIVGSELIRLGYENNIEHKEKICTMLETINLCAIEGPYGYKWPKLEELHRTLFGSNFEGAHDALADIQATAKCFWELRKKNLVVLPKKLNLIENNRINPLNISGKDQLFSNSNYPQIENTEEHLELMELTERVYSKQNRSWEKIFSSNPSLKKFLQYPLTVPPSKIWFDGSLFPDRIRLGRFHNETLGFIHPSINSNEKILGTRGYPVNTAKAINFYDEISTTYFISILEVYFKGMIFTDVGTFFSEKKFETLDFAPNILLYDKKTNLHLAINIDSPYDLKSKKIRRHIQDADGFDVIDEFKSFQEGYNNKWIDRWRSFNKIYSESFFNPNYYKFFKNEMHYDNDHEPADFTFGPLNFFSSWFFMKFSETQIVIEPHACCKFIHDQIYSLTGISLSQENFKDVKDITILPMWSYDTAKHLITINQRERLLTVFNNSSLQKRGYDDYEKEQKEWAMKHDLNYSEYDYDDLPF